MNVDRTELIPLIRAALKEDLGRGDVTSSLLPSSKRIRATVIAKEPGIVAGVRTAALTFTTLDPSIRCTLVRHSGAPVLAGAVLLRLEGHARTILAAERTALNFLGHLSGIATLTRKYVDQVPKSVKILDTRKTIPGLRALEKCAVGAGGGMNHRFGLFDAVLIKTTHLRVLGQGTRNRGQVIRDAVAAARRKAKRMFVGIEVVNLSEFRAALEAKPDLILLDNFSLDHLRLAVRLRAHLSHVPRPMSPLLEASGGVTLATVAAIAHTGVDRISVGRLTHSAPALDVSLQVQ